MKAAFETLCPVCDNLILKGHEIVREKLSNKYVHRGCSRDRTATENAPTADFTITEADLRRLNRPQLRVYMQLLGLPARKHATSVAKLHEQALKITSDAADEEKTRRMYDAVTSGGSTDPSAPVVVQESKLDMDQLCKDVTAKIGFNTRDINDVVRKTVVESIKAIAEPELKKHQKLDIKVGAAARKKMTSVLPAEFETMLKLAAVRQNILLIGPSGCGKTFLAEQLATALNLSFGMQSCSAGISESQLVGWLLPTGASGKFEYVPSPFITAYENGGVFLLDEVDAADPQILMIINAALANGHMVVPQRHKNPVVKRHKDFVCVAAANTFGTGESTLYAGREILDGATLDRFRAGVIMMDYSDTVEEALVDSEILAWGRRVRKAINTHKLERIMSTRVLIDFTKQRQQLDRPLKEMQDSYFTDWSQDEVKLIGAV